MGTGGKLEGSIIEGYEVLSVLGSGATGLLYEARHLETGEVAIVRRWRDGEGQELLAIFVREASPFLAPGLGAPHAEVFTSPEGTEVLLLRRARAHRATPRYPVTERVLPRPGTKPAPRGPASPWLWGLAVLGASLVGLLASLAFFKATSAAVPQAVVATARSEAAPVASRTSAPAAAGEPSRERPSTEGAAGDAGSKDGPTGLAPASPPLAPVVAKRPARAKVVAAPPCTFDDRFRDYARRTRAELRETAGSNSAFEVAEDALSQALVDRDCRKANAVLDQLRRLAGAPVDDVAVEQPACTPDARWKASSLRDLNDLGDEAARQGPAAYALYEASALEVGRHIHQALTAKDCAAALREYGALVDLLAARPVGARTAPREVVVAAATGCEPDEDWKRQARVTLDEFTQRSAKRLDLLTWAADENEALSKAIALAGTKGECSEIEQRLHAFNQRLKGKGAEQ